MLKTNEIRHKRRCVFNIHIHLVFITKYRKCLFQKYHLDYIKNIFKKVYLDFESVLVEVEGERDHVHLLVNYPPSISVSKLVNSLKGVSSRLLRKNYPDLTKYYVGKSLCSPSYFAGSCGGASLDAVKRYIENQNSPQ